MKITETLSQGLVTARPDTVINEGELTQAEECYYHNASGTLYPLPGKFAITQGGIPNPQGIRFVRRSGPPRSDLCFIKSGALFYTLVPRENAQAFGAFKDASGSDFFDVVQLDEVTAVLNGYTSFILPATSSNTDALGYQRNPYRISSSANAGDAWNQAEDGYYEWWYTEYNEELDIESGVIPLYNAADKSYHFWSVRVGTGGGSPSPTFRLYRNSGDPTNPGATHWRLYRSVRHDLSWRQIIGAGYNVGESAFPRGYLVDTVAWATTSIVDTGHDLLTPYPGVTISGVEGTALDIQANGHPPTPDTGCLFENSLVCNDTTQPWIVRWTRAGTLSSFPEPYRLSTAGGSTSVEVLRIMRVGQVAVVFSDTSIARINGLPRDNDPTFTPEDSWGIVSTSHGLLSRNSITTFTLNGVDTLLAFVSRNGLFYTDGYHVYPLERDLDWSKLIAPHAGHEAVLRDVPHMNLLMFFYTPYHEAENQKVLFFHYHETHRKEGMLKVTGPHSLACVDAVYCDSKNLVSPTLILLTKDGTAELWDRGENPDLPMKIRTRRVVVSTPRDEVGQEWMWLYHAGDGGQECVLTMENMGENGVTEETRRTVFLERPGFAQVSGKNRVINYRIGVETKAPIHYIEQSLEA